MIFSTTASNVLITDSLTFLNGAAIFSIAPDTTTTISGSVIGLGNTLPQGSHVNNIYTLAFQSNILLTLDL